MSKIRFNTLSFSIIAAMSAWWPVSASEEEIKATDNKENCSINNASEEAWLIDWGGGSAKFNSLVKRCGKTIWVEDTAWSGIIVEEVYTALPKPTEGWIQVSNLPGWDAIWDDGSGTLFARADLSVRPLQILGGRDAEKSESYEILQHDWGGALTYSAYGIYSEKIQGGGSAQLRIFGPYGVLRGGMATSTTAGNQRLPFSYRYDWGKKAVSVEAGDLVSGSLGWITPYAMRGVRVHRDFDLTPDRIIVAIPDVSSSASVPSAVDVFWGQNRRNSFDIEDGPFIIRPPVGLIGSGKVDVVVTGADGQKQTVTKNIYISSDVLSKGIVDFSVDAGELQGVLKDKVYSGSARYGVTNSLTVEGQFTRSDRAALSALGTRFIPGNRWGEMSLGIAKTNSDSFGPGTSKRLGYQWISQNWGLDITKVKNTGIVLTPADAAAIDGGVMDTTDFNKDSTRASVWARLGGGQAGLTYDKSIRIGGEESKGWLASWNRRGQRISWGFEFGKIDNEKQAGFSFNIPLGRYDRGTDITFDAERRGQDQSLRVITQNSLSGTTQDMTGWYAGWDQRSNGSQRGFAGITHWTDGTELSADLDTIPGGNTSVRASVAGTYVWMAGAAAAIRTSPDAFAVVDTNGFEGIPIVFRHHVVGITNKKGRLLIPDVIGWNPETFAIDTSQVVLGVDAEQWYRTVRIPSGQGGIIHLPVAETHSGTFLPLDKEGRTWAPGTEVAVRDDGVVAYTVVGIGGEVFVADIDPGTKVTIGGCDYVAKEFSILSNACEPSTVEIKQAPTDGAAENKVKQNEN